MLQTYPTLSPEDKEITCYYCYYCYFSLLVLRLYSSAVLGTTGGVGMSVFHFVFISRIFSQLLLWVYLANERQ